MSPDVEVCGNIAAGTLGTMDSGWTQSHQVPSYSRQGHAMQIQGPGGLFSSLKLKSRRSRMRMKSLEDVRTLNVLCLNVYKENLGNFNA